MGPLFLQFKWLKGTRLEKELPNSNNQHCDQDIMLPFRNTKWYVKENRTIPATAAMYRKPFHLKRREEELLDFSPQWQGVQCQQLHNAFTLKPTPPPAPLLSLQTALFQILSLADMKFSHVKPWSAFWDQRMPQCFVLWSILYWVYTVISIKVECYLKSHSYYPNIPDNLPLLNHKQFIRKCIWDCDIKGEK